MSELAEWAERVGGWPWFDIFALIGAACVIVGAVWSLGGTVGLVVKPKRATGRHANTVETLTIPVFLLALSGGAAASAVVWLLI